jgi:cytochrome c553
VLRFFRVRAWCLATALFLAVGTAGSSLDFLLHGDAAHHADPCVAPVTVAHDESAHRITAEPGERADDAATHCVACHLARALRLRSDPPSLAERPDDARTLRVPPSIGVALAPPLANLQPRSPPRVA